MLHRTLLSTLLAVFLFACGSESMAKYESPSGNTMSVERTSAEEMSDYSLEDEMDICLLYTSPSPRDS